MPESVYDVILLIGSSKESWEKAAANAVEQASKSLRNLRVAEIVELNMQLDAKGKVEAYISGPMLAEGPIIGKVWATTTQALADEVLKDAEIFLLLFAGHETTTHVINIIPPQDDPPSHGYPSQKILAST